MGVWGRLPLSTGGCYPWFWGALGQLPSGAALGQPAQVPLSQE